MLGASSKALRLRKRWISSLHVFSILAFGMSVGLDSQSLPLSTADSFIVLQDKGTSITLAMFDREPITFGRISNSDIPVAFHDEFNGVAQK